MPEPGSDVGAEYAAVGLPHGRTVADLGLAVIRLDVGRRLIDTRRARSVTASFSQLVPERLRVSGLG